MHCLYVKRMIEVMAVEIRHLRVLLAVVDAGSMSRAATTLGLSQPSVTRAMRELERHLRTELLDRAGRGATPTTAGREFTATARRLVDAFDNAIGAPITPATLRIAYSWAGLIPAVEQLVRTWNERRPAHPDIELIRVASPLSALSTAAADIAFIREWEPQPGYDQLPLDTEPRVVAVSSSDPLAHRPHAHFQDLADYGLVINTHSGTTPTNLWGHPHNPTRNRTTSDVEDWVATIATTSGVFGITPSSTADFYQHPALTYLPLRDAPAVVSSLVWLTTRSAAVNTLINHARTLTQRSNREADTV